MGFWADIRRDFKSDCEKYGKAWISFLVLAPVCGVLLMIVYTIWGEGISRSVWGPLEAVSAGWVGAAENVRPPYRGYYFFGSVVLLYAVASVTPAAYEGAGKIGSRRAATVLRGGLAVSGMALVYGLFAIAVLCIDPEGDRFLVCGQAVLTFAVFVYAVSRVTMGPFFE